MALEGKMHTQEQKVDTREFIQKADIPELLQIARQTGLASHPLVRSFDNPGAPAFYQKGDDLRRLMHREQKNHADFRNKVVYLLMRKQP